MTTPRRSTPRRARSSSVTSNASAASTTTPSTKPIAAGPRKSKKSRELKEAKAKAKEAEAEAAAAEEEEEDDPDDIPRPPLPDRKNPVLPEKAPEVKLQIIRRDSKEIIIGRVKLPTVNHSSDHAFLLRRFDTDAMAASSMFRVAFPYAGEEAEQKEMDYLEHRFDCIGANGGKLDQSKILSTSSSSSTKKGSSSKTKVTNVTEDGLPEGSTGVKLQGTWIPSQDALSLAKDYGLIDYALPLIEAQYTLEEGESVPQLIFNSTKNSKSTSSSSSNTPGRNGKRQKVLDGSEASTSTSVTSSTNAITKPNGSPALVNTKTIKTTNQNGTEEIIVEKTETSIASNGNALTPEEIEAQIKASKNLVKDVKSSKSSSNSNSLAATPSRKRRAVNDAPTADGNALDDDEEVDESSNTIVRGLRRGTRAARRRPIVTSAGTLGAGVAVGAASLAWAAGGNLDVALQLLQNGATQVGSWFF